MTIQFADDFKGYGGSAAFMLDGLYGALGSTAGLSEDPDPNVTGSVFSWFTNPVREIRVRRVLSGDRTTVGYALRLWMPNLPAVSNGVPVIVILDGSNHAAFSVCVDPIGRIYATTGSADTGPVIGITGLPVLGANSWNHIEVKANRTAGTLEVRVNGVTKLTLAGVDVGASFFQWGIDSPSGSSTTQQWFVKDLVVWDGLGTENNDFLGSVQVVGRVPTSDVTLNWTPSTGTTGWPLLDNSPPLDATEYLTAPFPAPAASTFGLSPLPADVTSVKALITQCRVRNIDGGDGSFQASLVSVAATANGANRPITSAFTYYEDVFEHDPNTAAPWTAAAATAAKIKINRTV